jgi:hypothetical protein
MKAEIENKIMLLVNGVYLAGYCDGGQKTNIRIEVSEQATSSLTSLIIKWLEGKRKEKIDITKKMCHNLEYPSPCLYDEPNPNGATCTMQDKNIPKEKCKDYKDFQVEYEDFAERNQLITELVEEIR